MGYHASRFWPPPHGASSDGQARLSSVPGGDSISFENSHSPRSATTSAAPTTSTTRFALAIATGGGAGYAPIAPGTFGSLVGVLLFVALAALPLSLYAVTALGVVGLGIWAADLAERAYGRKDDGRIVIDEIAGQLIALAPLLPLGRARSIGWVVTGFVAFRLFDIWKPGPVRWLERNLRGGAGVMLDDVAAGALAAGVLAGLVLAAERLA